jgi:predicted O-methyltransferase YrrM
MHDIIFKLLDSPTRQKIIGAYEQELYPLVERLVKTKSYRTIYNVGAAEGFYSVGLARLFPQARIHSFESETKKQRFCELFAGINEVADRIETHGTCTAENLAALKPEGPALVWMDIDTGERPVLNPAKVPRLRQADVFVVLHDCLEAGLSDLNRSRFTATHRIERLTLRGRDYDKYNELQNLSFVEINAMVEEDRKGLHDWFFMEPLL